MSPRTIAEGIEAQDRATVPAPAYGVQSKDGTKHPLSKGTSLELAHVIAEGIGGTVHEVTIRYEDRECIGSKWGALEGETAYGCPVPVWGPALS